MCYLEQMGWGGQKVQQIILWHHLSNYTHSSLPGFRPFINELPLSVCGKHTKPAAVIYLHEEKNTDTGNFTACCSVTQSQEVRQGAHRIAENNYGTPTMGVAVFNMCSDMAACLTA